VRPIISLFRSVYQICTRNVCTISEVLKSKPFETHFVKKTLHMDPDEALQKNEPVLSRVILFAITDRRTDGTQIKTMLAARDTPRGRAQCKADTDRQAVRQCNTSIPDVCTLTKMIAASCRLRIFILNLIGNVGNDLNQMEKRSERRKHWALAVVRHIDSIPFQAKFSPCRRTAKI